MTPEELFPILTVIMVILGVMLSPIYAILLWQNKRLANSENCIVKVKTALRMRFPELQEILK
jgi:hypothetical protein